MENLTEKEIKEYKLFKKLHTPTRPTKDKKCPNCGMDTIYSEEYGTDLNYCTNCGQAINHTPYPKHDEINEKINDLYKKMGINYNGKDIPVIITVKVENGSDDLSFEIKKDLNYLIEIRRALFDDDWCEPHRLDGLVKQYPEKGELIIISFGEVTKKLNTVVRVMEKIIEYKDIHSFDNFTEKGIEYCIYEWQRYH